MDVGTTYLVIALSLLLASALKDRNKTKKALMAMGKIAIVVFPVLFLIFILMGIIQAFVPRETIASWLGSGSGIWAILVGEVVGCFALIQPAAVFPFAGFLHDNGANYGAILGFVMTAILIGISTLPLELKMFGGRLTLVRNLMTFVIVFLLGLLFNVVL